MFPGPCVLLGALSLKICDGRDAVPRAVLARPELQSPLSWRPPHRAGTGLK